MKNKIGWCNLTFNPVWGCLNNCPYCYSRRMAKWLAKSTAITEAFYLLRNKLINQDEIEVILNVRNKIEKKIKNFEPIFLESKFNKKFPQKAQKVFVGSMSEIKYWKKEWMERTLEKIRQYPQHIFQFLTKFPGIYLWYKFPVNCWLGITITDTKNYDYLEYEKFKMSNPDNLKFISFEPLLNEISINLEGVDWVILGAETGGRKDKVFAKRCWIESILINCYKKGIPVYIKESIIKWQPQLRRFKGFPEVK